MTQNTRDSTYADLHAGQLLREEARNRASAMRILGIVFEYLKPASVLDVGCGLGTWLAVAGDFGVTDLRGVEGRWLDRARLAIDPATVATVDLENGFDLERKFELAICLEVAEHLFEAAAPKLIESLARHADVVLFSAAIPHQGGHHHVNERFADYWAALFAVRGLRPLDVVRPRIWTDQEVLWWLRQNVLLFVHDRVLKKNKRLHAEMNRPQMLSVVHPEVYVSRVVQGRQIIAEHQKLVALLQGGGTFAVTCLADGRLNINKL